jgi:hypothetical protein
MVRLAQKSSTLDRGAGNISSKVFPPAIAGPATLTAAATMIKVFFIFIFPFVKVPVGAS